jgi:phenylpyruvate tautomerase PptA (4-oxalocrotonate tautomerase family)
MPIAHVHVAGRRTPGQRKAILDAVHAALVEAFRVPDSDRNQLLHEHDPELFEARRGPDSILVEVSVFPGRRRDAKRLLYRRLAENLSRAAGVASEKILIVLHEPPLEDWGIRGGQAACDVELGFKLDV